MPASSRLHPLLLAATLAFAGPALADRNVYTAAGEVRTTAPVTGDYAAAGGDIYITHPISGDASLAGGSVEVRAPVGDDLRVAGGKVRIDAAVGGELLVMGGNISLEPGSVVARDARLYGSKVTIAGRVEDDLDVKAERVIINGEVKGDARLTADSIELGPLARIEGNLRYISAHEPVRADGAQVNGNVTRDERAARRARERHEERMVRSYRGPGWLGGILAFLGVLAVAALLLLAAPGFAAASAQRVRTTPWTALGLGLATLLALPMLAVLLFVTVLGIPIAFALVALYPVALLLGFVVSVVFVARRLPPAFRLPAPQSFGPTMGWFAAALLLLMVVARIPFAGPVLMLLVGLAGLGAGLLEIHARRKRPPAPDGGLPAARGPGPVSPADDVAGAQA
jgi:cytoskeletal protein CcmA (bactofilin family)